jgi:hypothetical protein
LDSRLRGNDDIFVTVLLEWLTLQKSRHSRAGVDPLSVFDDGADMADTPKITSFPRKRESICVCQKPLGFPLSRE